MFDNLTCARQSKERKHVIIPLVHGFIIFLLRDDHQFSPLHWAAKGGHQKILEMLIGRGARVHTTNMGDDTPLHLASAHGHREAVQTVVMTHSKTDISMIFFLVAETEGGCQLCQ